ncbi:MAG TPA: pilus assembly PilX N-terminal domain-containing protein [Thermoanaerobaculia bacterium]|nr:pilus assembly PilX N-terminal domain-containing protein [Thermoanaerobaculia bacterium]
MHAESHRRTIHREEGSAYVAVLMVLIVLTIFGLALSMITQTEMQVGSNERTVNRVFYAADAGIEAAIAKALVTQDFQAQTYDYTDSGLQLATGELQLGSQVQVSAMYPIAPPSPCNLCEINQAGGYGGKDFYKVIHGVTATATRFGTLNAGVDRTPLAQKTVSAMIEMQPFEASMDSMKILDDPDALQQVKF